MAHHDAVRRCTIITITSIAWEGGGVVHSPVRPWPAQPSIKGPVEGRSVTFPPRIISVVPEGLHLRCNVYHLSCTYPARARGAASRHGCALNLLCDCELSWVISSSCRGMGNHLSLHYWCMDCVGGKLTPPPPPFQRGEFPLPSSSMPLYTSVLIPPPPPPHFRRLSVLSQGAADARGGRAAVSAVGCTACMRVGAIGCPPIFSLRVGTGSQLIFQLSVR